MDVFLKRLIALLIIFCLFNSLVTGPAAASAIRGGGGQTANVSCSVMALYTFQALALDPYLDPDPAIGRQPLAKVKRLAGIAARAFQKHPRVALQSLFLAVGLSRLAVLESAIRDYRPYHTALRGYFAEMSVSIPASGAIILPNEEHWNDYMVFAHRFASALTDDPQSRLIVRYGIAHGLYNAFIHGAPLEPVRLAWRMNDSEVQIKITNVALDVESAVRKKVQLGGIPISGMGSALEVMRSLFDHVDLRTTPSTEIHPRLTFLTLTARRRSVPRGVRWKRAVFVRLATAKDTLQLLQWHAGLKASVEREVQATDGPNNRMLFVAPGFMLKIKVFLGALWTSFMHWGTVQIASHKIRSLLVALLLTAIFSHLLGRLQRRLDDMQKAWEHKLQSEEVEPDPLDPDYSQPVLPHVASQAAASVPKPVSSEIRDAELKIVCDFADQNLMKRWPPFPFTKTEGPGPHDVRYVHGRNGDGLSLETTADRWKIILSAKSVIVSEIEWSSQTGVLTIQDGKQIRRVEAPEGALNRLEIGSGTRAESPMTLSLHLKVMPEDILLDRIAHNGLYTLRIAGIAIRRNSGRGAGGKRPSGRLGESSNFFIFLVLGSALMWKTLLPPSRAPSFPQTAS